MRSRHDRLYRDHLPRLLRRHLRHQHIHLLRRISHRRIAAIAPPPHIDPRTSTTSISPAPAAASFPCPPQRHSVRYRPMVSTPPSPSPSLYIGKRPPPHRPSTSDSGTARASRPRPSQRCERPHRRHRRSPHTILGCPIQSRSVRLRGSRCCRCRDKMSLYSIKQNDRLEVVEASYPADSSKSPFRNPAA